jgi:NAD(P)-dependent dehydrogenase (short-subunit alcohol dehydrogenase family)
MAYSRSKLAIVLSTVHLAEKLRETCPKMRIVSIHPGVVRTGLAQNHQCACGIFYIPFLIMYPLYYLISKSTWEGAQTTLYAIHETTEKLKSGGYYSDC